MERFPSPSFRKPHSASGDAVNTPMLSEELAPLNAQIEQVLQKQEVLEGELRVVEAELEAFSADRERLDALREVCNALDRLRELKADELFWEGAEEAKSAGGLVERARSRVACLEREIRDILEKQASLRQQINQCLDELDGLYAEVGNAYDREERRTEEFAVEREVSSVPSRRIIMPWTDEAESRKRLRRAVLVAILLCLFFGSLIPMIKVPIPDRSVAVAQIPKRLVELVKEEPFRPARKKVPKRLPERLARKEAVREETPQAPQKQQSVAQTPEASQPKAPGGGGTPAAARKKAEAVGVLAFKDAFKDLMKETPVAKLGTEARLSRENPRVAGKAVAQRSLVSIQAKDGSSGGIGYAGISRNVGSGNVDRLGGPGIGIGYGGGGSGRGGGSGGGGGGGKGTGSGQMSSAIANLEKSSRPVSDGVAPGRTDEEIQIVFDRHKAELYRIYNKELRKDPTLRGKILMRLTIEPSGVVSMCKAESTDLASPELVDRIVERIKRFNFGPKEGVKRMTILYPIDFLPAS